MLDSITSAVRKITGSLGPERSITTYLPQFSHILPHVIRNVDGSIHAMFSVAGVKWEDLSGDELVSLHEGMCSLHRTLNLRPRLTITKHLIRTEASSDDYPRRSFRIPFVADLDRAYRHRLIDQGHLSRNSLLLGIVIRPPTLSGKAKREADRDIQSVDQADLDTLEQIVGTIRADIGASHGLKLLNLRNENGRLYSEIAEAHAFILTARYRKVPIPKGRLSLAICPLRPVIRNDRVIELHHAGRVEYAALSGISVYPAETDPSMFHPLLSAPYRLVLNQSMGTMPLHGAQGIVTRTTNQFVSSGDPAATQKEQLALAADELQQRHYGLGVHNITLMVLADSEVALQDVCEQADDDFRNCGAIISRLDWDLEVAYFGQIPGAEGLHARAAPWKSRNFAAAAPLHNFPTGWRNGRWCDFGALLTTNGGTPYYWNPHTSDEGRNGDVPHFFMSGPNGSGKTTVMLAFLGWLMDQAQAQAVLWDKDRGAKLFVMRMSGAYIEINIGTNSDLAPLWALDADSPADMNYLTGLVRSLILSDGGSALSSEDDRRIPLAVRTVMSIPRELRSFHEIRAFLGAASDSTGARLRRWCRGEDLGWVLDNPRDRIRLDAQLIAFDQTKYLDHKEACGPIQSYLFHRVGKLVDGRRMIVAIDEFWKSLTNAAFRGLIQNGLATFRKQNCAMWLATQSVGSALKASDIAHTIREQCLTQMHFPNGGAQWSDFGPEGLGFPERAFSLVKTGLAGGGKGRFLLKQGSSYTPVQLCLEGMDDIIATLSGRTESVALMDRIEADMPGADMDNLFAEFHRRRKLPEFLVQQQRAWKPMEEVA